MKLTVKTSIDGCKKLLMVKATVLNTTQIKLISIYLINCNSRRLKHTC